MMADDKLEKDKINEFHLRARVSASFLTALTAEVQRGNSTVESALPDKLYNGLTLESETFW